MYEAETAWFGHTWKRRDAEDWVCHCSTICSISPTSKVSVCIPPQSMAPLILRVSAPRRAMIRFPVVGWMTDAWMIDLLPDVLSEGKIYFH